MSKKSPNTSRMTSKNSSASKIVKSWRELLAATELNTKDFVSETLLLVESSDQCFKVIDKLIPYILQVEQSRLRVITAEDVKKMADGETQLKNLGDMTAILKKAIADAKVEMKASGVLSTELEALIIKIKMLIIRNQYVSHKENYRALQNALHEENKSLLGQEEPIQVKGAKKAAKVKPVKKGKSEARIHDPCEEVNRTQYSQSVEIKKKMKALKQSEEFAEAEEGIDLYFVLAKVYNYELYKELQNIGVEIISLVDLSSNATTFPIDINYKTPFDGPSSDKEVRKIDVSNFWRACGVTDGDRLLMILEDTCYLRYCPKFHLGDEDIYSDVLRIAKNLTDFKRLHREYLENMKVFDVEETKPPVKVRCMNTYNKILNKIPNEFQNYSIIMHALIEEVMARLPELEVDKNSTYTSPYRLDRDQPPKKPKRHGGAREQIIELFKKFERKEQRRNLECKVKLCETRKINYGNALEYMFCHAPFGEDLKDIFVKALSIIEPMNLFQHFKTPDPANRLSYDYLFHKWANDFEGVPINKLRHCIHAYLMAHGKFFDSPKVPAIRSKNKTSNLLFMDLKPYNKDCKRHPSVHLAFLLSTHLRDLFKKTKFGSLPGPAKIHYCEHVEEYDSQTMAQMIYYAFKNHRNYQYRYFEGHDVLLLKFQPVVSKTTAVPYNFYSLRTPVCFRDFCAYIIRKEIDWLCDKDKNYWVRQIDEKETAKSQSVDDAYILNPEDFIMPGSLKDTRSRVALTRGPSKGSSLKKLGSKTKKPPSKNVIKEIPKTAGPPASSKRTPKEDEIVTPPGPKVYDFEGYNVNNHFMQLRHIAKEYTTVDGYKISIKRYHWKEHVGYVRLKAAINDNWLIFNFIEEIPYITCNPVKFNLHVSNGIIMGFGPPRVQKIPVPPCDKCVATYEYQKTDTPRRHADFRQTKRPHQDIQAEMQDPNYIKTKKDLLDKIKMAAKAQIPIFKICSTRLHKYHYVKRIKSHVEVPIGKLIKRLTHKPRIYKKLSRHFVITKCFPSAAVQNGKGFYLDFEWKATLPTGLCVQTVQGIDSYPIYIKQGYIIDRDDLNSIENEDYRCFIKGKVLSFQKNGEVVAMHFNRVIENRQYGYFSSNVHETRTKTDQLRRKSNHSYNLHKATRNTSKMERKIRKICQKYSKHLIGLSENYRLASKREGLKRERNTYKLSKKIYQLVPNMLPLLKLTTITQDGSKVTADTKNIIKEDKKYYTLTYNDYMKRETMVYRQDGTLWFLENDGKATTQFPDSTRITTWTEVLDEALVICHDDGEPETDSPEVTKDDSEPEKVCCRVESCFIPCQKDAFVLYGMNYKYEHPYYMSVTELCADNSIVVDFPDNVSVKISEDGSYKVNLQDGESVEIDKNLVKMRSQSCSRCNHTTKCKIKIKHLHSKRKRIQPEENLLWLLDRESNLIKMNFGGHLTEEIYHPDPNQIVCNCDRLLQERYFVLKRDLSGSELFHSPPPNKFIYTLKHFPARAKSKVGQPNATCLMQHLYKTYSESLMMLYDIPLLGMISNFIDSEELFRSFDYDEKSVILLRTPLYLIERTTYHLQLYNIIESLVSGFYKYLHHSEEYKCFKPSSSLVEFIKENTPAVEIPIETFPLPIPPIKKPHKSKFRDFVKKREYKKLLNMPRPNYFTSTSGTAFQYINECLENAFEESEKKVVTKEVERKSKTMETRSETTSAVQYEDYNDWACSTSIYSTDMFLQDFAEPEMICKGARGEVCEDTCNVLAVQKPTSEHLSEEEPPINASVKSKSVHSLKSASPKIPSLYCTPVHCCPITPKCSEVSICSHVDIVSLRGSCIMTAKKEFSGKATARDILHTLYTCTEDGNIDSLTTTQIQRILIDEIQAYKITEEDAVNIVKAFHDLVFTREEEGASLFATAIGVIKEAKSVAEKLGEETSDSHLDLEDMTVKASCIMYNVLDSPHSKGEGIIEIQKLFEDAKLSKKDAHRVLELTAKGLEQDLRGSANDIQFEKPLRISSDCAVRIIEQLERVVEELLLKKGSDPKESVGNESVVIKRIHQSNHHHYHHKNKRRDSGPKLMHSESKNHNNETSGSTVDNCSISSTDQNGPISNIDSIINAPIESYPSIGGMIREIRTIKPMTETTKSSTSDDALQSFASIKERGRKGRMSLAEDKAGKNRQSEVIESSASIKERGDEEKLTLAIKKRKPSEGNPRKKSGNTTRSGQKKFSRYTSDTEQWKKKSVNEYYT